MLKVIGVCVVRLGACFDSQSTTPCRDFLTDMNKRRFQDMSTVSLAGCSFLKLKSMKEIMGDIHEESKLENNNVENNENIESVTSAKKNEKHSLIVSNLKADKAVQQKLELAAEASHRLRFRITLFCFGFGLSLVAVSLIRYADGLLRIIMWSLRAPALAIIFLGIMPQDRRLIRGVSVIGLCILFPYTLVSAYTAYLRWSVMRHELSDYASYDDFNSQQIPYTCSQEAPDTGCVVVAVFWIVSAIIYFCCGLTLIPNLVFVRNTEVSGDANKGMFGRYKFKISAPQALDTLWGSMRWFWFIDGCKSLISGVTLRLLGKYEYASYHDGHFAKDLSIAVVSFGCVFIFNQHNRNMLKVCLSAIATSGETRSAASIAALLGDVKAKEGLAMAKSKFRAITFTDLVEEDFSSNKESENETNNLFDKTSAVSLGRCDAFISHSWHDNGKKKFAALRQWSEDFKTRTGRYPTFWLDKACINQNDISSDLLCLPVFLAGCEHLLIIAGPTYTERLWCIMEMGGSVKRITVVAIDLEEQQQAHDIFQEADVTKCKCFLQEDKDKILNIIQSGFGSFGTFNSAIRQVFNDRMTDTKKGLIKMFSGNVPVSPSAQLTAIVPSTSTKVLPININ